MSALPPKADMVQHGGNVALCQKQTSAALYVGKAAY